MAMCTGCGAASAEGAAYCASCGRPLAPPPPSAVPGAGAPPGPPAPPPPPGQPYAPAGPGYPPPPGGPAVGSWGAGTPYQPPAAQSPVLRWLTGDWRPALLALIAPTAVLLLAAMLAAIPDGYDFFGLETDQDRGGVGYGDRFQAAVAAALTALGAPFRMGIGYSESGPLRGEGFAYLFRMVPMTVTVLWLLALWLGLRSGLRRFQLRTGAQPSRAAAFGEAARTAVAAAGVTALLGLVGGLSWQPERRGRGSGYGSGYSRSDSLTYDVSAGWAEALGWTALLAAVVALLVYGTDALRWAAWRSRTVRGWAVSALAAGQGIAAAVGLSGAVAFVVVAVQQDEGALTTGSLAVLPNLGLLLLGFGSGASFEARNAMAYAYAADDEDARYRIAASFFDLQQAPGEWRWAGLLAVASALFLGWTAFRRRLDSADRLRLAVVYAVGLSLLMAVAGGSMSVERTGGGMGRFGGGQMIDVGLTFGSLLLANAVWAAIGALVVPAVLASARGRGGLLAGPYGPPPQGVPQGVPYEVPQGVPYPPAPGTEHQPQPGAEHPPAPAAGPAVPEAAEHPGAAVPAVSEVLGSHEEEPRPAAAPLPPVPRRPAEDGEEPVDPSVWRKHP